MNISGFPTYVLAGGRSRRFGSDKARIEIGEQPQLLRLLHELRQLGYEVYVVADSEQRFADLHVGCLVDVAPDRGPAAGLQTALQHRYDHYGIGWLLCLGCDQLLWRAEWLDALLARTHLVTDHSENDAVGYEAVVFAEEIDGVPVLQPLPALYHTCFLPILRNESDRALSGISIRKLLLERRTAKVFGDSNPRQWSFNTPEELAALRARISYNVG